MADRIAFIGLGNMGLPMALNLKRAGHDVVGFDLSETAMHAAAEQGLGGADNLSDAVSDAAIIITMLPAGRHVVAAWSELLPSVTPGALLIDCSTIDVDSARAVHDLARVAGFLSLDAPVSGGTVGATEATLTFMCGGDEPAFARAEPVLAQMGRRVVHCGAAGAGQAAKICNNMLLGISMIGVAEAFVLAEKLGLSHQALFDVASTSSGQCWSLTTYCPVPGPVPGSPANRDYKPGFATALMLKDLTLAQAAAESGAANTPLGRHARDIYAAFEEAGGGSSDFSGIINFLRDKTDGSTA